MLLNVQLNVVQVELSQSLQLDAKGLMEYYLHTLLGPILLILY